MPERKVCNSCGSLHDQHRSPVCPTCDTTRKRHRPNRGPRNRWREQTPEQREANRIYHTAKWRKVRQQALIRDGYRCQHCGTTQHLIVHHDIEVTKDPGQAFNLDNLETLCRSCHGRTHTERNKN